MFCFLDSMPETGDGGCAESQPVAETIPDLHEVDVHPQPQQAVNTGPNTQEIGGRAESQPVIETVPEAHEVDVHPEPQHVVNIGPNKQQMNTSVCDFFL